jgi:hypothetical protein
MKKNIECSDNLQELSIEELKSFIGGEPQKSSNFPYDVVYYATYLITRSEILTAKFWVDWGYAIL